MYAGNTAGVAAPLNPPTPAAADPTLLLKITKLKDIVKDQQEQIRQADHLAGVSKLVHTMSKVASEPGQLELTGAFVRWRREVGLEVRAKAGAQPAPPVTALVPSSFVGSGAAADYGRGGSGMLNGGAAAMYGGAEPPIIGRVDDALKMLAAKASAYSERAQPRLQYVPTQSVVSYQLPPFGASSASLELPPHVEGALHAAHRGHGAPPQGSALMGGAHHHGSSARFSASMPTAPPSSALHQMSEADVSTWLRSADLGDYAHALHAAGFSGPSLVFMHRLASTDPATYFQRTDALGMKPGHAAKLAERLRAELG